MPQPEPLAVANREARRHPDQVSDEIVENVERPWKLREASDFLRESERTTRRRVERGELPAIRLPGSQKLLFNPAEVRRLVASTS